MRTWNFGAAFFSRVFEILEREKNESRSNVADLDCTFDLDRPLFFLFFFFFPSFLYGNDQSGRGTLSLRKN